MSTIALLNAFSYVDAHDFTGDTNQISLNMEAAALDKTTFRSSGWTELVGGLKTSTFDQSGYWQAGTDQVDPDAFTNLATRNRVHTMGPVETEQNTAYMWQAGHFSYQLLGTLGELAPFTLQSQGTDGVGVLRGQLAKELGNVSATGATGSAVNLGAGSAGDFLYMAFHVFSAGTTISAKIQSDNAEAFSSPADVVGATVGPITTTGGTWMTRVDASAISDTWFRLNVTAITGTFSIAAAMAIQ